VPVPVTLDWDGARQADWDRLIDLMPRSTLEQTWAYGAAAEVAQGHRVRRAVVKDGETAIGLVQVLGKPLLGAVHIAEILRGPLWLPDAPAAARQDGLAAIRSAFRLRRRRLLLWMPEMPQSPESNTALRALGMRPMLTGYSSVWLDLSRPLDKIRAALDGKWRNALRHAERSRLKAQISRGGRAFDWLLERHDAFRRARRFRAPSPALVKAFAAATRRKSDVVVATAALGSEFVAGALFLVHGRAATYYVGWSGAEGRQHEAQNLLLWQGIAALQDSGVTALDLGGIDTRRSPGIARFKLGLGGEVFTLAGTWL
jgi:hypothetical protein